EQVLELQKLDAQESKDLRQRGLYQEKALIPAVRSATPLIPPQDPEMCDPVEPPSVVEVQQDAQALLGRPERSRFQYYFILHLFSGRRRMGDLQDWIEHFQTQAPQDRPVWTLSLDVASAPVLGDLSVEDTIEHWLKLARAFM
ncbi:unnamed protein product, partial [Prorocentrum cordatum]